MVHRKGHRSGQIIATSHDQKNPKVAVWEGNAGLFQGNLGW